MFMTSWYFALVALLIAAGIYKYIEYKGSVFAIILANTATILN
jgi:hypothetical protein